MMKTLLMLPIILIVVLLADSEYSFAEKHEVTAVGEYTYGDRETREDAKRLALEDAKRNALEKIVVYIQSQTVVRNYRLTEDYIKSYTAGKMQILDRDFRFVGDKMLTCIATIRAVVDIDMEEIRRNITVEVSHTDTSTTAELKRNSHTEGKKSSVLIGAVERSGHYYKVFDMKLTWDNAENFCRGVGGHLATAETQDENEFLKSLVVNNKNFSRHWLGGKADTNGVWRWNTSKVIDYFDWLRGEPGGGFYNLCLIRKITGTVGWGQMNPNSEWGFICEWESAENAHDSTL